MITRPAIQYNVAAGGGKGPSVVRGWALLPVACRVATPDQVEGRPFVSMTVLVGCGYGGLGPRPRSSRGQAFRGDDEGVERG